MSKRVSLHEFAELELNDAADFYESRQPGLGRSFIVEVQQATRRIVEGPESAQVIRDGVRRMILRQFPYSIIYLVTSETIRVLAIASQKRRPFYWRGRA